MTQIDRTVILDDADALARHAASWLHERISASEGPFAIALSGGSTPRALYRILATDYADRIDWSRLRVFFGDERMVPPDSDRNNAGMAHEALLAHVPIPPANVHPMPTEGDPAEAARDYEALLKRHYRAEALDASRPLFDVVLLGLGENGHTASLFPDMPVLEETLDWVGTCMPTDAPDARLTLTFPAIASSREVAFLIAGAGKAAMLARVREGDRSLPAARIASIGRVNWFVDRAADGGGA